MDALDPLAEILVIASVQRALEHEVKETNAMSRIREKLAKAKTVAADIGAAIEERADGLIARGPELLRKADEAFTPHEQNLADLEAGINEIEDALRQLSNAPLEKSTNGLDKSENPPKPQS